MQFLCNFCAISRRKRAQHACLQSEQRCTPYAVECVVIAALHGRVEAASDAMAVRTARGVVPQARARVLGTRTDSERLVVRREGAKGAFQWYVGTCRRGVATRKLARR